MVPKKYAAFFPHVPDLAFSQLQTGPVEGVGSDVDDKLITPQSLNKIEFIEGSLWNTQYAKFLIPISKLIVVDIFIKENEVIFKSLKETYGFLLILKGNLRFPFDPSLFLLILPFSF